MLVQGTRKAEPLRLHGVDTLLESWADYILVYDEIFCPDRLKSSLEKALDVNPYFAGRKYSNDGIDTYISGGNEGALLECEFYPCPRPQGFQNNDYSGYSLFCSRDFREQHRRSRSSFKHPLFQIKLSIFEGSTVVGISVWHGLADGTTFFNFIELLASIDSRDIPPRLLPDFTRFPLQHSGKDCAELIKLAGQGAFGNAVAFREVTHTLDRKQLARIIGDHECENFMSYDFLAAHYWRKIALAGGAEKNTLYPVYDVRQLAEIGENRVGNLLCYPVIQQDLVQLSGDKLNVTAGLIREGIFDLVERSEQLLPELVQISAQVTASPKGSYTLLPLFDSWFGSGVLFNNLMGIPWQAFRLADTWPVHLDMPLSDGLRFLQIYPCLAKPDAISVKINLPADEMERLLKALSLEHASL